MASIGRDRARYPSPVSNEPNEFAVIIFGTRAYFRTGRVTQHGFCENCNQLAKLRSYTAMNFVHVYFVPLIPISGRQRHHKMCPKCNRGREMSPDALTALINGLKERSADALVAMQSGDATFGEPDPHSGRGDDCVDFLRGAFDYLYAAGEREFCDTVIASLSSHDLAYAREMLAAAMATMDGKIDPAIEHYEAAALADSARPQPLAQRGHLLVTRRRRQEAIDSYQAALQRTGERGGRVGLLMQIADEQMALKQFDAAVDAFESAIAIVPSLAEDKSIAKNLKKARKKSGRPEHPSAECR